MKFQNYKEIEYKESTNRYGVVEKGFWDNDRWFAVCKCCDNIKHEALSDKDLLCEACSED